ncbi:hypothetical protein HK097_000872 [Rhizophlyctis rosea]|uniref:Uncharacterized protein n=1 Tax=Rhizophlyctis rosea TaxID=64517 RepID=A0AAD5X1Q2_9FUNG|nr:hypothetical protein HK097_000872 [Rhizophlyctis rosea]
MRGMLQKRIDPLDQDKDEEHSELEKERLERMYVMLKHSKRYRHAQVADANAKWNASDESLSDTSRHSGTTDNQTVAFADTPTDNPSAKTDPSWSKFSAIHATPAVAPDWEPELSTDRELSNEQQQNLPPAAEEGHGVGRQNSKRGVQFGDNLKVEVIPCSVEDEEDVGGQTGWASARRKSVETLHRFKSTLKKALP